MAASSASPYGTWRGSSSSRITGLTNRILAMTGAFSLQEPLEGRHHDAGPEQDPACGAVERLALGLARHLEEHVAKPVVRGVAEPRLPHVRILEVDEGFGVALAQQRAKLRVVLRARVRRARRVGEVHAHDADPR